MEILGLEPKPLQCKCSALPLRYVPQSFPAYTIQVVIVTRKAFSMEATTYKLLTGST